MTQRSPEIVDGRRYGRATNKWGTLDGVRKNVPHFRGGSSESIMFQRVLKQIRDKVRSHRYVMTLHAEEEMSEDELTIFDVERCIFTGEIVECQKDTETGELKYVVKGQTLGDSDIVAVTKMSLTGKLVIITVYRL